MGNTVLVNAASLSPYALKPLLDGESAFERAMAFARTLPDVSEVVVLTTEDGLDVPETTVVQRDRWTVAGLFEYLSEIESDHLFYLWADCPFFDGDMTGRMYENHLRYFAQYTYADGYPYGLAPEILSALGVKMLAELARDQNELVDRESVFTVLQKDINAFDIETDISPVDHRMLRLSLTADTKRNYQQLTAALSVAPGRPVWETLVARGELLRQNPAYVAIQVIDGCPQACSYCPYPTVNPNLLETRNGMALSDLEAILEKVAGFCDDAVIGLGLWGEPGLHPRIADLVKAVLAHPRMRVLLETSGVGWDQKAVDAIGKAAEGRVDWIVSLDALDPALYANLRGDGHREATAFAEGLRAETPDHVWLQAVRMNENEEDLERFFKEWTGKGAQVIVQKHDDFSGFLPKRKVTDLSPVKRFPCWHLKRDLSVLLDGRVPLCREDVRGDRILGNILEEDLAEIWGRSADTYTDHLGGEYPGICENCDEYYTYNF